MRGSWKEEPYSTKKRVCKIFLKLFCWFDELYIKAGIFGWAIAFRISKTCLRGGRNWRHTTERKSLRGGCDSCFFIFGQSHWRPQIQEFGQCTFHGDFVWPFHRRQCTLYLVEVFMTSLKTTGEGQGHGWCFVSVGPLLGSLSPESGWVRGEPVCLVWPAVPVLSTEAFTAEKQQSWQIQTAHAASVSQHTDPRPTTATAASAAHAARGRLGSHLAACPLATFGAPFLPALTHVLSPDPAPRGLLHPVDPSTRRQRLPSLAYSDLTYLHWGYLGFTIHCVVNVCRQRSQCCGSTTLNRRLFSIGVLLESTCASIPWLGPRLFDSLVVKQQCAIFRLAPRASFSWLLGL